MCEAAELTMDMNRLSVVVTVRSVIMRGAEGWNLVLLYLQGGCGKSGDAATASRSMIPVNV